MIGGFGFSSGLPLLLTFFTLQQWLSEIGLSLRAIGSVALFGLPYLLKFVWAPLLDRRPPGRLARMGRRRGWLLPVQAGLTLSLIGLATRDPAHGLTPLALAALLLAFFSASQDICIDAWRIERFAPALQAAALGAYSWGYRLAMLCSGAGTIALAARIGWHEALLAMAALSLLGPVLTLLAPEPPAAARAAPALAEGQALRLGAPFRELLGRPGAGLLIAFVLVFNLGTQMADSMAYPFYHRLGFAPALVAAANGVPALIAALAGAACSSAVVAALGVGRGLILCACVQMLSILLYVALARTGPVFPMLLGKVTLEGFAEVLATTTFATYLSRLCSLRYTATQFALLSSLAPVAWRTLGGASGILAEALGWRNYFLAATLLCLPGILIMLVLLRRFPAGLPASAPLTSGQAA